MATNLQTDPGPGLGELVSGIVQDAQELIGQQLALFKQEMRQDLKKAREGVGLLALAAGTLLVGSILLGLMLVHLLFWLAPSLPLWSCYAIVGGVLAGIGTFLAMQGREKLGQVMPEQTTKALEENLEWKTKPN
jgi:uncharacterized protein YacL